MTDSASKPTPDSELHGVDEEGVWPAIRAALVGRRLDYTRGSIPRSILLLAVPMVLEMMMESLFAVTDTWFVGKLGTDAVAVVGLTSSLVTVIFCLAIGLSMAATAMVARRIGAGDVSAANVVAVQCVFVACSSASWCPCPSASWARSTPRISCS